MRRKRTHTHFTYILKSNNHISIANDPVEWAWQHKKLHFVILQRTFRSTKGPKDKKKIVCTLCQVFCAEAAVSPLSLPPSATAIILSKCCAVR